MSTFDEYQKEAARTGGSDLRDGQTLKGMSCAGLGLTGEATPSGLAGGRATALRDLVRLLAAKGAQ